MKIVEPHVSASCRGRELTAEAILPRSGGEVIFEFISDRNTPVSKQSDVSPRHPNAEQERMNYPYSVEMWFPVVDIQLEPGMTAQAEIKNYDDRIYVNSFAWKKPYYLQNGHITIPAEHLVQWENGLFVKTRDAVLTKFSLQKKCLVLPTISKRALCNVNLLSDHWSGTITVHYEIDNHWESLPPCRFSTDTQSEEKNPPQIGCSSLEQSLNESIRFILGTCNNCVTSPHKGGFYLFYDLDADTYRQGQWPWGWGPAIRLLMDSSHISSVSKEFSSELLRKTGYNAAKASLRFQAYHPYHITDGLGTTRYSPRQYDKTGFQELVSAGSDSGFLVGWGWIPVYKETGDPIFLEAAKAYAQSVENVLSAFDLPPQDWLTASGDWIDFTIDESGFGTEGIAELYSVTGEKKYAELAAKYMDRHTKYFERPDGLWNRCYNWHKKETTPTFYNTRGLGWAFEGLLATWHANPEKKIYLEKAVKMADVLLTGQQPDGSWNYNYIQPVSEVGTSEKGTALYSLLYYRLYHATKDGRYLAAARNALKWCMEHQYMGENMHARGGIIACSPASCVTYRAFFNACCNYTSGFLGLAILEEMKLS